MEKKITYQQYRDLFNLKEKGSIWAKLAHYTLEIYSDWIILATATLPMWVYILIFIPIHVFEAVALMWNGGLCEMEVVSRHIQTHSISKGGERYEKAKKLLEGG